MLLYEMRTRFVTVLLSWTIHVAFATENATDNGVCNSCELSDRATRHKLYNWLVLGIVLLLLVLLLILVGFLCYRLWPRDNLVLGRAAFRCELEHERQRVLVDTSTSQTSRGEKEL